MKLWDALTGRKSLKAELRVSSVAFSPDGRHVASPASTGREGDRGRDRPGNPHTQGAPRANRQRVIQPRWPMARLPPAVIGR